MASSLLVRLPREVRDLIYEAYFWVDGGYVYDCEANRLVQADGACIEVQLAYACRQIAHETRGLGLRTNTITFSTHFWEVTRYEAGLFHAAIETIKGRQTTMLGTLAPRLLTSQMAQIAAKRYPQFTSILNHWSQHGEIVEIKRPDTHCGEAPSIWSGFVRFTLELVSQHPRFLEEAESITPLLGCNALALKDASFDPWTIPGFEQLKRLIAIAQVDACPPHYWAHVEYTYSAASVALRFLRSLSASVRTQIRKIVLREDSESVARPECHGNGFISFCLENPKLRIERFVSLWRNAFPVKEDRKFAYIFGVRPDIPTPAPDHLSIDRLFASSVTKSVGTWIVECLLLPYLGMPEHSYTLVLDGNPIPDKTTEVFNVVQRDAAWQTALDICYARGLLPLLSWLDRRLRIGYTYEELPKALREISYESSLIRCNFDPGSPYDPEAIVEAHSGWSVQKWEQGWEAHDPPEFQTESPLPPWHILRWRRVLL